MKGKKYGDRACRATGGKTEEGVKVKDDDKGAKWYSGEDSNVKDEAEEPTGFKKGGKVGAFGRGKMAEGMHRLEMKKKSAKAEGDKAPSRLDRPKRASGGKVASGSRSPFAVSEKTSERPGFKGSDMND